MSSLIFYTAPDEALVITDTLTVSTVGDERWRMSKSLYVPHVRAIVAATGVAALFTNWAIRLNMVMAGRDFDTLGIAAAALLPQLAEEMHAGGEWPEGRTATIYHFGYSAEEGCFRGHAFRSTNGFQLEVIEHGGGIKPPCEYSGSDLLADVPAIMATQRREQESKPEAERLYIGGEAIAAQLTRDGCMTWTVCELGDP